MDFDFSLILVIVTFVAGIIWAIDKYLLEPKRTAKLASIEAKTTEALPEDVKTKTLTAPGWADTGRSMFPVLFIVFAVRSFVVEPFQIPSGSMLPTLQIGDFIAVNKFHYGIRLPVVNTKIIEFNDVERGDVMVFRFPKQPSVNYIKRVIGLPGDKITYLNKRLYVNDEILPMELIELEAPTPTSASRQLITETIGDVQHQMYRDVNRRGRNGEWVVPEGHYFMVGDNRDNSNDSRFWGFVPDHLVVGKAFAVWMHWESWLSIPDLTKARFID